MRVDDTEPVGAVIEWDIEQILERVSTDMSVPIEVCPTCDLEFHDGDPLKWGEQEDCCDDREPASLARAWQILLAVKRMDGHYEDVRDSIDTRGFVRPATAWYRSDGKLGFGDGHHRLAAAIDLGMTTIPVIITPGWAVARDSGEWHYESEIPLAVSR